MCHFMKKFIVQNELKERLTIHELINIHQRTLVNF